GAGKVKVTYVASGNYYQIEKQGSLVALPALQGAPDAGATYSGTRLTVPGTSGDYILTDGKNFVALPAAATASQIKTALATFANIGTVTVTAVTGQARSFDITVTGSQPQVAATANALLHLDVLSPVFEISQFPTVQGIVDTLNTAMNNALAGVL